MSIVPSTRAVQTGQSEQGMRASERAPGQSDEDMRITEGATIVQSPAATGSGYGQTKKRPRCKKLQAIQNRLRSAQTRLRKAEMETVTVMGKREGENTLDAKTMYGLDRL
eukprot:6213454-Pleurochrysis_carterae.AAC.2